MTTITLFHTTAKAADGSVRECWWATNTAEAHRDRVELAEDAEHIAVATVICSIPATPAGLADWLNKQDILPAQEA